MNPKTIQSLESDSDKYQYWKELKIAESVRRLYERKYQKKEKKSFELFVKRCEKIFKFNLDIFFLDISGKKMQVEIPRAFIESLIHDKTNREINYILKKATEPLVLEILYILPDREYADLIKHVYNIKLSNEEFPARLLLRYAQETCCVFIHEERMQKYKSAIIKIIYHLRLIKKMIKFSHDSDICHCSAHDLLGENETLFRMLKMKNISGKVNSEYKKKIVHLVSENNNYSYKKHATNFISEQIPIY